MKKTYAVIGTLMNVLFMYYILISDFFVYFRNEQTIVLQYLSDKFLYLKSKNMNILSKIDHSPLWP